MKKIIVLNITSLLLVCIIYSSSMAQETNAPRIGIRGGVNFSNLYTKDADKTKMLTGFNFGIFTKVPVTNNFAVQPELNFTTKGAEVTYNGTFVDGTARFNLNYLEVPLLLVINVSENFNVHVGPYAAYLLSGKVSNQSNVGVFDFEKNIDPEDYNKLDAGIAAGAGIDIGAISLGARYNYGLTKVGKEKTFLGTSYTFPDANNGVLSLYLSLSL